MTRRVSEIAREIRRDWGAKLNYAARPYLDAMDAIEDIAGMYHADRATSVVRYFLANAGTWRGEAAKRVKAELRQMCKQVDGH